MAFWLRLYPPSPSLGSAFHPTLHSILSCVALVISFSRDTILGPSMTLVCLSGAKSLRDPSVSQLLGECVATVGGTPPTSK